MSQHTAIDTSTPHDGSIRSLGPRGLRASREPGHHHAMTVDTGGVRTLGRSYLSLPPQVTDLPRAFDPQVSPQGHGDRSAAPRQVEDA